MIPSQYNHLIEKAKAISENKCLPSSWQVETFKIILSSLITEERIKENRNDN